MTPVGVRDQHDRLTDPLLAWVWRAGRAPAIGLAAVVVVGAVLQVLVMVASGRVIQALVDGAGESVVLSALGLFGAASVGLAGVSWVRSTLSTRLSWNYVQHIEFTLASAALGPVTIAHLEDHQIREQLGVASGALREGVHQRAVAALVETWATRLAGVASGVLLFGFHWWAPLVLMAGYVLLIRGHRTWLSAIFDDLSEQTGDARRRAEYLRSLLGEPSAAKEVRVFGLTPWLDGRFARTWTTAMQVIWANRGKTLRPVVIGAASLLVALAVVLGVLGYEAGAGLLPVGLILVYVQAVAGMDSLSYQGESAWDLSRARQELTTLTALVDRLRLVGQAVDAPQHEAAKPHGADDRPAPAASSRVQDGVRRGSTVSVQDVTFSYPGTSQAVLRGLTLKIPAGQSVAIVGVNGAGKSTLMKLLCGLYRPTSGQVLIDGEPATPGRRRVAAIFQSFGRYELSLADNVAFGDPSHIDDRAAIHTHLVHAGATALLHRVDLDTVLAASYTGGTDLSGGQWQRVALARALMSTGAGAGLLILDEPTAALDIRAEVDLFNRFLDVTRGLTTVLVSHRLSSVRHADRIVVLSDGLVTEDGTHEELIAAGGRYATMFRLQAQRFHAADTTTETEGTDCRADENGEGDRG